MTNNSLSYRMHRVIDMVSHNANQTIADVGCDHAYVSMYLVDSGFCSRSIAMDVRKGPLEIAKKNVYESGLQEKIDLRLSDGLDKLKKGEAQSIVIAGMGGNLIINILRAGIDKLTDETELILQPQSDIYKVRQYLYKELNYIIIEEDMIIDENKFYTIIKAKHRGIELESKTEIKQNIDMYDSIDDADYSKDVEYFYGKLLLESKNEVLRQFLIKSYTNNENILSSLKGNSSDSSSRRIKELEHENSRIKEALDYYDM